MHKKMKIIEKQLIGTLKRNTRGKNVYRNQKKENKDEGFKKVFKIFPIVYPFIRIAILKKMDTSL